MDDPEREREGWGESVCVYVCGGGGGVNLCACVRGICVCEWYVRERGGPGKKRTTIIIDNNNMLCVFDVLLVFVVV